MKLSDLKRDKGEQTTTEAHIKATGLAVLRGLSPGLKWASTKARMELLGARFRTRTLIKSLCAADFLNNSLS